MALLFELAAECGDDEDALAVARHFAGWSCRSGREAELVCDAEAFEIAGASWVRVVPRGFGGSGVNSAEEARRATEVGNQLYERLRTGPAFRFALVGVEAEGVRSYEDLEDPDEADLPGLVLAEPLWARAGCPEGFEPFAPGYVWRPWPGETWDART